jgi:hypothetical protein
MGRQLEGAPCRRPLSDLLEVGVERREAVVRGGRAAEEEAHRVALVTEGGLDADEHVAELGAEDQQVVPVRVEVARGRSPVLLQVLARAETAKHWATRKSRARKTITDHTRSARARGGQQLTESSHKRRCEE